MAADIFDDSDPIDFVDDDCCRCDPPCGGCDCCLAAQRFYYIQMYLKWRSYRARLRKDVKDFIDSLTCGIVSRKFSRLYRYQFDNGHVDRVLKEYEKSGYIRCVGYDRFLQDNCYCKRVSP